MAWIQKSQRREKGSPSRSADAHLLLLPPLALAAALRLGPSATEGQSKARRRRQRLPLPPLASRLAPSPPSSAHRPATPSTHLPPPSRLCCIVGARPAAQGGRALAPPLVTSPYAVLPFLFSDHFYMMQNFMILNLYFGRHWHIRFCNSSGGFITLTISSSKLKEVQINRMALHT